MLEVSCYDYLRGRWILLHRRDLHGNEPSLAPHWAITMPFPEQCLPLFYDFLGLKNVLPVVPSSFSFNFFVRMCKEKTEKTYVDFVLHSMLINPSKGVDEHVRSNDDLSWRLMEFVVDWSMFIVEVMQWQIYYTIGINIDYPIYFFHFVREWPFEYHILYSIVDLDDVCLDSKEELAVFIVAGDLNLLESDKNIPRLWLGTSAMLHMPIQICKTLQRETMESGAFAGSSHSRLHNNIKIQLWHWLHQKDIKNVSQEALRYWPLREIVCSKGSTSKACYCSRTLHFGIYRAYHIGGACILLWYTAEAMNYCAETNEKYHPSDNALKHLSLCSSVRFQKFLHF